eukprot:9484528-Pyramimonas_sp.AAC.1
MLERADEMHSMLTPSQLCVVDAVVDAVDRQATLCLFVDAFGGTGKTFCLNTALMRVRGSGRIALAVGYSGISALLLQLGRTFHSRFRAPLQPPDEGNGLPISAQTGLAELCRRACLIVFDEA